MITIKRIINRLFNYTSILLFSILLCAILASLFHFVKIDNYSNKLYNLDTINVTVEEVIDLPDEYLINPPSSHTSKLYVKFYEYIFSNTISYDIDSVHNSAARSFLIYSAIFDDSMYALGIHDYNNSTDYLCDMIVSGKCLNSESKNEIVVSQSFANLNNVSEGETISINHIVSNDEGEVDIDEIETIANEYKVVGIVEDYYNEFENDTDRVHENEQFYTEVSSYIYISINDSLRLANDSKAVFPITTIDMYNIEISKEKYRELNEVILEVFDDTLSAEDSVTEIFLVKSESVQSNAISTLLSEITHFIIIFCTLFIILFLLYIYLLKYLGENNKQYYKIKCKSGYSMFKIFRMIAIEILCIMGIGFVIFKYTLANYIAYFINFYSIFSIEYDERIVDQKLYEALTIDVGEISLYYAFASVFLFITCVCCYMFIYNKKGLLDD